MKLNNLIIKNFMNKQGKKAIEFKNNLPIAIVGENGAGKSVIAEAISFALTGNTQRFTKKEELINELSEESEVTLNFSKHNENFSIYRKIGKSNKRILKQNGEPIATKSREITEKLEELGINLDLFYYTTVIKQDKINQLTEDAKTFLMDLVASIIDLDTIKDVKEKIKKDLDKETTLYEEIEKKIKDISEGSEVNISKEKEETVLENINKNKKIEKKLSKKRDKLISKKEKIKNKKQAYEFYLQQLEYKKEYLKNIKEKEETIEENKEQTDKIQKEQKEYNKIIKNLTKELEQKKESFDKNKLNELKELQNNINSILNQKQNIINNMKQVAKELKKIKEEKGKEENKLTLINSEITKANKRLDKKNNKDIVLKTIEFLESINKDRSNCPICNGKLRKNYLNNFLNKLKKDNKEKVELQEKLSKKEEKKDLIERKIYNLKNRKSDLLDKKEKLLEQKEGNLNKAKKIKNKMNELNVNKNNLEKEIDELKNYNNTLNNIQSKINHFRELFKNNENQKVRIVNNIEKDKKKVKEIKTKKEKIESKIEESLKDKELLNQDKDLQKELKEVDKDIHEIEKEIKEPKEKIRKNEIYLDKIKYNRKKLQEKEKNKKEIYKKIEILEKTHKELYPSSFPRYVTSLIIEDLLIEVNKILGNFFDGRYKIRTNEDLDLMVEDQEYFEERSISGLSGAEKTTVSLAFIITMSEYTETNFLFIDEGFGDVSKHNIPLVYKTLRNFVEKTEKKLMVITHSYYLGNFFENKMHIKEGLQIENTNSEITKN